MLPFPDRVSHGNRIFDDLCIRFVVKIQPVDEVENPVGRLKVESFLHAGLQFRYRTHHSAGIRYLRPHWPLSAWTAQPASALSRHCFEKICRTWDTCSGFRLRAFAPSS